MEDYRSSTKEDWTNPGLDENRLDENHLEQNELDEK